MMMKISKTQKYAVELIAVVLFLATFNSSNSRSVVILPKNNSRVIQDEKEIILEKSVPIVPMEAVNVKFDNSTSQFLQKGNTSQNTHNTTVNIKLKDEKQYQASRIPLNLGKETAATLAISTDSTIKSESLPLEYSATKAYRQISEGLESNGNNSKELLSAVEDVGEISSIFSTTYRPAWSSLSSNISAQERERRLMLVLAARRSALHRGTFGTRIGTTSRIATVSSVNSTSKTPTDRRTACLRNCTKNFTRRTTASCMRQCANISYSGELVNSKETSKNVMIVRKSSLTGIGTQISDRENNEVLFTDESSHGLFVIAKEQNDTSNHIPAIQKSIKTQSRSRILSPVTIAPSSIEDDNIQPYLYFGEKLPPIKPATLKITSVSHEQPMLFEVSSIQLDSTTPKYLIPTSSLSAVERSRARYKYRDRGYVTSRRSTSHSFKSWEPKSRLSFDPSTITSLTMEKNEKKGEMELIPVDSSTPITVTRMSVNETTLQSNFRPHLLKKQAKNNIETTTIFNSLVSHPKNIETSHSITTTPTLLKPLSSMSTTKLHYPRDYPSNLHSYSTPSTATINIITKRTNFENAVINATNKRLTNSEPKRIITKQNIKTKDENYDTFAKSNSSTHSRTIIEEDNEKLKALGPSLTQEVINDENFVIFLNQTTPDPMLYTTTNSPTSIFRTTELTPVRSSMNSNTENSYSAMEINSTQLTKVTKPSFVGIIETTPIEIDKEFTTNMKDIKSSYVNKNEVTLDMRRVNVATMVLAAIGIIPLCAIILYLMRSYIFRHDIKNEEDFDVYIGDQQPISPIKKIASKYQIKNDEEDNGANRQNIEPSNLKTKPNLPMVLSKVSPRDKNHNNHYDEQCSVTSDQEFDRSNIRLKSLLGEGNFGQVWKAEADNLSGHFGATRIVAVKTIRKCSGQASLKEEGYIMRKLGSHPNVVTLLGACLEMEPHMLIMEYAMRGRLLSLLRAARNATNILPASVPGGRSLTPLSQRTLGGFALDIACGMEYIAEKRIVHRDLAARNVLLDHNGVCKICDFGMSIDLDIERKGSEKYNGNATRRSNSRKSKFDFGSRYIINQWNSNFTVIPISTKDVVEKKPRIDGNGQGHDTNSRRPPLPIRWMAPEAIQYHIFSHETDVWAFGIVLWEIATLGCTPYANLSGREVIRQVPTGLRPDLSIEGQERHEFHNLMTRCWQKEPHLRPSFTFARQEISRYIHKWVDDQSTASDYMDVSGFSEDLEQGMVYFNHRISEFECEI